MGNSAFDKKRDPTFNPHLHFEIKDRGVLGDRIDDGDYWGYTPDLPDGFGYYDPRIFITPFVELSIVPVSVRVVSSTAVDVLTGPGTSFSRLTRVRENQAFVAFKRSGSWYRIYLPNANGPISGWVAGTFGGEILVVEDPSLPQIEVFDTGTAGLVVRPSAGAFTNLVGWDNHKLKDPGRTCRSARIWDGQRFVYSLTQAGWYRYHLPENRYIDSSICAAPIGTGPSHGWSSGASLKVP
jgi:hypothetical protein